MENIFKKKEKLRKIKAKGRLKLFYDLIASKKYDQLYTIFGKEVYMLFAPFSHKAKDIKKLMKDKDYVTIYNKYGKFETFFIKNFRKASDEQIEKLLSEERYFELAETYKDLYFDYYQQIYEDDVFYETGSKWKAKLYKTKKSVALNLDAALKDLLTLGGTCIIVASVCIFYPNNIYYKESIDKNKILIEQYDEKVTSYAEYINNLKLDSDLDVVMKVMYDMWNEMEGYGVPKIDLFSMGRLDFVEENGVGVCRNIADDFSARLNAINPEYNARNVIVFFDRESYTYDSFANIEVKLVHYENSGGQTNDNEDNEINLEWLFGNHMVTMFEPIGKDYTLVVDSTNPSIGIVVNGKIYMFSTVEGKGLSYRPMGQSIEVLNYDFSSINNEFISSFIFQTNDSKLNKIKEEWGINSQNKSLEYIESLDDKKTK